MNSLLATVLKILAGFLAALAISPAGIAAAAENPSAFPAAPVYNSESFGKELRRLNTGLESARNSQDALRAFRESIPEAWTVEAGARRYDVSSYPLVSKLQAAERTPANRLQVLDGAREYLDALAAETASLSGEPIQKTASARAKLDAILARPEFAHHREAGWWDRLRMQISEMLLQALGRILRRIGGPESVGNILLWLAICGAALLIVYWIFRRWFRAARTEEMALQFAGVPARSWQEWVFAARQAAAEGEYRAAVHCAYWAGVARLQDLGALSADRSKTPREYLRALGQSNVARDGSFASRRQALSTLTSLLEKIWYGHQTATLADFRDSLAHLETLECHLP